MTKEMPVLFTAKEDCCGCTACFAACPVEAIEMKYDNEGFLYPIVSESRCIRCYKCVSVCPIKATVSKEVLRMEDRRD